MNIELIVEFEPVFIWMAKDVVNRRAALKAKGKWWRNQEISLFCSCGDYTEIEAVVPEDEHVECRIAWADGKPLQILSHRKKIWLDIETPDFSCHPEDYRIKPSVTEWTKHCSPEKPLICDTSHGFRGMVGCDDDGIFMAQDGVKFDENCPPITADDLHDFQRKGYYTVDELENLLDNYSISMETHNVNTPQKFVDWLRGYEDEQKGID